jgi:hypothetical protein
MFEIGFMQHIMEALQSLYKDSGTIIEKEGKEIIK